MKPLGAMILKVASDLSVNALETAVSMMPEPKSGGHFLKVPSQLMSEAVILSTIMSDTLGVLWIRVDFGYEPDEWSCGYEVYEFNTGGGHTVTTHEVWSPGA